MYKVSIKVNNIKAKNLNKYFHTTNRHMKTLNFIPHSEDAN